MRRQPGPAEGEEIAQRLVGDLDIQHAAIDQWPAVARQGQRDAGQGGDGAAGADQPDAAGADFLADAMHLVEAAEMRRHLLDHRMEAFLGEAGGADAFRQGHHAERHGDITDQLGRHLARAARGGGHADPGDLGAAAADIEQQRPAVLLLQQRGAGFHRQLRFLPRRDDAGAEAGLGLDPGEEGGAVLGAAAGFGGDRLEVPDRAAAELLGAGREGGERAVHRRLGQPSGGGQAFAESDDAAEAVHHAEAAMRGGAYQQAAIIRAEIERRIGGGGAAAPGRIADLPLQGGSRWLWQPKGCGIVWHRFGPFGPSPSRRRGRRAFNPHRPVMWGGGQALSMAGVVAAPGTKW